MTAMFLLRYALAASVAACFAGGVAAAQSPPTPPPASNATPPASPNQPAPTTSTPTDNATPVNAPSPAPAGSNVPVTVDANGVRHMLITSPTVPDTPENRAKYGPPMSNAGRRTQAAGN
jgi:hypothetical protein